MKRRNPSGGASGAELYCTGTSAISCTQYRLDLPLFVLFGGYFQRLNGQLESGCSAGARSPFLPVTQQINVLLLRDWGVNATDVTITEAVRV